MSLSFQVVIDSSDPHPLADWWAETLGWQVEEQDESFIRRMVEQGHATEAETTTHHDRLVWAVGAAITSPVPGLPRVLFQQVPEAKTVKNRVHLDLRGSEDVEALRKSLLGRGATWQHDGRQGPSTWVTMTDPEGNEFCV